MKFCSRAVCALQNDLPLGSFYLQAFSVCEIWFDLLFSCTYTQLFKTVGWSKRKRCRAHIQGWVGRNKSPKYTIGSKTFPILLQPGAACCKVMHSRRSPHCRGVSPEMWWQLGNGTSQLRLTWCKTRQLLQTPIPCRWQCQCLDL